VIRHFEPDPVRWTLLIDWEVRARLDTWEAVRPSIRAALAPLLASSG
jgi:hypothetical protein